MGEDGLALSVYFILLATFAWTRGIERFVVSAYGL